MFGLNKLFDPPQEPPRRQEQQERPYYAPPVAPPEPRIFIAHTYSGEERRSLTLAEARRQVDAWASQGAPGFISNVRDPEWEDTPDPVPPVGEAQAFSPEFIFAAIGPDPKAIERFAFDLLELNGQTLDFREGEVVVYDMQEGE